MLYLIVLLAAVCVASLTFVVVQAMPARPAVIGARLAELEKIGPKPSREDVARAHARRSQWEAIVKRLGERIESRRTDTHTTRLMLVQAGFRRPDAPAVYWGARVMLPVTPILLGVLLTSLAGPLALVLGMGLSVIGFVAPAFFVGRQAKRRQREIRNALPDALDSLVVCVEAGLGLNQAMNRVAEEMRHFSQLLAEELIQVNLEIRAGTPRDEALRNLATRTGVDDIHTLVTMLIQTEKFGTSVAQALRVQSDTLRTQRRQRAEEAAAKSAIKMLFPLVFLIFPALFVILIGPAILQVVEAFSTRP